MNIRSPKNRTVDLVAAEASAWFVEFRTGEMTAGERTRFYEWLRRSPEHIQAYLEVAEGWAELPTSDPEHRLDIQGLIERARTDHDENVVTLPSRPLTSGKRRSLTLTAWAAALAGVTFAIGLAWWVYVSQADKYRTGVGEQRTVRLLDGSKIELNALSSVRVSLSNSVLDVDLIEGQAFFHVAKDSARPFLVHSDGTTVRAVGTQFDVYRKSTGTVVTVLEGRVAVAQTRGPEVTGQAGAVPPAQVFLIAGEQVTVPVQHGMEERPQPKQTDVAVATAWVQKRLVFEETPLAEVAEEFNRYNTRHLLIVDPKLRTMGISGVYSSTDPDSLLGFLRAQPNIQLTESPGEIRVSLREKK